MLLALVDDEISENFRFPSVWGRDGLMWKVGLRSILLEKYPAIIVAIKLLFYLRLYLVSLWESLATVLQSVKCAEDPRLSLL